MITESKCTKHLAKDHTCGFGDILADRQTDRQTHTHTDLLITLLPNRSHGQSKYNKK